MFVILVAVNGGGRLCWLWVKRETEIEEEREIAMGEEREWGKEWNE